LKRIYLELEDNDPLLDVIKKYGITQSEMETAISAWAYTIAREEDERDEVWKALNNGFRLFRRRMMNVDVQKFREIFKV